MNKEWFIFKGTHHLGPFSLQEMEEFVSVGEINAQSLVWREGAEKWEALGKIQELKFLVNKSAPPPVPTPAPKATLPELPELPDLPDDLPPPMPKAAKKSAPAEMDEDEPPPIPLDAILNPDGKRRSFKKEERDTFSLTDPKVILGLIVSIFILVVGWFYTNEQSSAIQIRIKGMMPVYLEKLQEVATQKTPSFAMTMALSLDGKTLYASSNKEGEIVSIIKMQSLPKRTLGTEDVEILVRGVIRNHLGEFSRMQLTKGPQFVPGEYNIDFTGRRIHFLNRKFRFLNDIGFFKKLNTTFTYHTSALIYAGTPREFETKITQYRERITEEKMKPFTDKLERLQTFQSLLTKTMENYILTLESVKRAKDMDGFERGYIKEVSPIIQSLVVAANENSKKFEGDEEAPKNKIASFKTQMMMGKQIGELASDMIEETKKLKKFNSAEKNALRARFEGRYKNIKSQIDANITLLSAEIDKIGN